MFNFYLIVFIFSHINGLKLHTNKLRSNNLKMAGTFYKSLDLDIPSISR